MLSLYIHIPFCVEKCRYCGFYSTRYSPQHADGFIDALNLEASAYHNVFAGRPFNSVYIGGGTPSVLDLGQLERLFTVITKYFQLAEDVEFTVEANPNTITIQKLGIMLEHGVNRLSLGVQSFSNSVLQTLGRLHTAQEALDAFTRARSAGFSNISIDLIFGIPSQTMEDWNDTLNDLAMLKPEHVSAYSLSLDEGSSFYREAEAGRFTLPDDETVAMMHEHAVKVLQSTGYHRYEVSNFSFPGFECRHNINYWQRGECLGLGPGAWSFIAGTRYNNLRDVQEYTDRLAQGISIHDFVETVDKQTAAREIILLSLRTVKGLDLCQFEREFGTVLLGKILRNSAPLQVAGLLQLREGRMMPSERGFLLLDEALARLSV